jgi:hypothetical protein
MRCCFRCRRPGPTRLLDLVDSRPQYSKLQDPVDSAALLHCRLVGAVEYTRLGDHSFEEAKMGLVLFHSVAAAVSQVLPGAEQQTPNLYEEGSREQDHDHVAVEQASCLFSSLWYLFYKGQALV